MNATHWFLLGWLGAFLLLVAAFVGYALWRAFGPVELTVSYSLFTAVRRYPILGVVGGAFFALLGAAFLIGVGHVFWSNVEAK